MNNVPKTAAFAQRNAEAAGEFARLFAQRAQVVPLLRGEALRRQARACWWGRVARALRDIGDDALRVPMPAGGRMVDAAVVVRMVEDELREVES